VGLGKKEGGALGKAPSFADRKDSPVSISRKLCAMQRPFAPAARLGVNRSTKAKVNLGFTEWTPDEATVERRKFAALASRAATAIGSFAVAALAACSGSNVVPPAAGIPSVGHQAEFVTGEISSQSSQAPGRGAELGAASAQHTVYVAAVLADKPTVYYRLNQKSGTTFVDFSGNKHAATISGSVSMGHTPLIAGDSTALSSSFAGGYAHEAVTWPQRAVTAECWIRPTAADVAAEADPRLLGNGWTDHDGKGFMLWLSQGHPAFNTGWNTLTGPQTLKAGSVYHVVGTFAANSPDIDLYVNGSLVAKSTYGYVPTPQTGDSANTYFGVLNTGSFFGMVDHFQGDMSDCAVYNQALPAARVSVHYVDGRAGATPTPSPTPSPRPTASPAPRTYAATVAADKPLVYYRLNQKSGTIFADSSGNGHPATTSGKVAMGHPALIKDDSSAASASFAEGEALESVTWPERAITAECWIRPVAADRVAGNNPRILENAWSDIDGKGFMLWLKAAHVAFSTGTSTVESPTTVQAGQAYYVAATFEASSPEIELYVDGSLSAKGTYTTVPTPQTGDTKTTFFGVLYAHSIYGLHFQGDMSDCAIYDYALTAAQIHDHYVVGAPNPVATPTPAPKPSPTPVPKPSPTPSATATPNPTGTAISYNATSACIEGKLYTNDVLPAGVGEFSTNGLNRAFWGGKKTRTVGINAGTWGPGFMTSWGRHQYDTYFGDSADGTGYDPFSVVTDTAVSGSPKALRIEAMPMPAPIATSLTVLANDQWPVTSAGSGFAVPSQGGSLKVNVANPNAAQTGWHVGIGYSGAAITFIGTLTSGGSAPSGNGTGGSNPWTISNIHVYAGTPGTTVKPGSNDEGGFRAYNFPQYYSGTLDTNVNQQYGFFVARIRLPKPAGGLSPAWWMLETGGVGTNAGQLLRSEWDIEEQFGPDYGTQLNAGNILWNSGNHSYGCGLNCPAANNSTGPGATGVYPWPSTSSGDINTAYHDYGVLIAPGGPQFPTNYKSGGGVYVERNSTTTGTTFYLDGRPIAGHVGQPDLTQNSPDKELMMMFQVGSPGSWLDPYNSMASNSWPQYMYAQWLRAYKPTSASCS
jgi:hypothetical protein